MAVFTPVTEDEVKSFLQNYDLGELLSFEGIQSGVSNTNYHVFTDRGRYILTIFEDRRTDISALPFFFGYTDHLVSKGIKCPQAIHDREDRQFSQLLGKPAAFVNFLEGKDIEDAIRTPEACASVGDMVARMHVAAEDFAVYRDNSMGMAKWYSLIDEIGSGTEGIEEGLSSFISDELCFLNDNWPKELPQAAVHTDIFSDNVFFEDGNVVAVIDFSFSCTEFLAYDLAIVINAWCFDSEDVFQPERFDALMGAYQKVRQLEDNEKEALPVLLRGAAMRFLSSRMRDWLFHDPAAFVTLHDPKEFITKLRFHQNEQICC